MDNTRIADAFEGMEGEATASPDALSRFYAQVERALRLQEYVDQMEADLKAAKSALNETKQKILPDLMAELRMQETVSDGYKITINDFVSGNLPNEEVEPTKYQEAVKWLEDHDAAHLLKTTVTCDFGKSEHNVAVSIAETLRNEYGIEPKVKSGVHSQTLWAFARERIANGEPIDTDKLGLYVGRVAKISKVSENKRRKK